MSILLRCWRHSGEVPRLMRNPQSARLHGLCALSSSQGGLNVMN
jgi:hypothetical protein